MIRNLKEIEIFDEAALGRKKLLRAKPRLCILAGLYPNQFQLPSHFQPIIRKDLRRRQLADLKEAYWSLSEKIASSKSRQIELQRTCAEFKVFRRLSERTTKQVLTSVLIGSHFIDLFVPNVRSSRNGPAMKGLAIEVDGDVHNYESKMRKDDLKAASLQMIGIGLTSIQNHEINEYTVEEVLKNIKGLRTLDSRDRRRLWTRICALTLALNYSDSEFLDFFSNPAPSDSKNIVISTGGR